ncbi:hypothetical protein Bca52824_010981 [Brassica carinata]|uniref:Uncharacterized protein n=1 Tax=Brassica carinata TaxID=52824 RepID=A0A8X8BBD2_BRACI|nr:hypothetical protein Bca52824_010981 [Brassica carinata]
MFELMAESNPEVARIWRSVRPRCNPTPEEQADLERQTDIRSSELRTDLNLP